MTGIHTINFGLYTEETGGTPLWTETHVVDIDSMGLYDVNLGSFINFETYSGNFSEPY
ncbi:hypothetical protein JXI42_02950 [bacterium]|nr:hypothetical protein [bacterium]